MKLNSVESLTTCSWPEVVNTHPLALTSNTNGYRADDVELPGWRVLVAGYVREPTGDQEVSGEHREGTRKCVQHQRSDVRRDDQVDWWLPGCADRGTQEEQTEDVKIELVAVKSCDNASGCNGWHNIVIETEYDDAWAGQGWQEQSTSGDVRRHAHTAESEREAKDQIMKQAIKYNKYARHGGRRYRQTLTGSEEGKTEGCMKHEPNGREESETARDWDPRTHEENSQGWDPRTHDRKSNANSRRTKAKISTRNARRRWKWRCPRATRGSNTWRQHVEEQCFKFGSQQRLRGELERVCPERVQRNHHRQKGKLSQSEKSIGWWKRQRITEKRKSPTSRTSWPSQGCDLRNSQNQAARSAGEDPGAHSKRNGRMTLSWEISQQGLTDWTQQCNCNRAQDPWRQHSSSPELLWKPKMKRLPKEVWRSSTNSSLSNRSTETESGQARGVEPWQDAEHPDAWVRRSFDIESAEYGDHKMPSISGSGRWCRPRNGSRQREWLKVPHQRKWPLVQVKKDPSRSGCWRPISGSCCWCRSCRKSRPRGRWLAEWQVQRTYWPRGTAELAEHHDEWSAGHHISRTRWTRATSWARLRRREWHKVGATTELQSARGGCVRGRGRATMRRSARITLTRRWQDRMRDMSRFNATRLAQGWCKRVACKWTRIGCVRGRGRIPFRWRRMCKAISAIKTLRRRWIARSNVLSDELEEDEDLHNKMKYDHMISDEQITADNAKISTLETNISAKSASVAQLTDEIDMLENDSNQVQAFRCDRD